MLIFIMNLNRLDRISGLFIMNCELISRMPSEEVLTTGRMYAREN